MWIFFRDEDNTILDARCSVIRLVRQAAGPHGVFDQIQHQHLVRAAEQGDESAKEALKQRERNRKHEIHFDTSSCRCIVRFANPEDTMCFYNALQQALATGINSIDLGEIGLKATSVEVGDLEITGEVRVRNTVAIRARNSLPCTLDEDSAVRVITEDAPIQVRVMNEKDDPVPIEDVH
jgi:hypothetical protein